MPIRFKNIRAAAPGKSQRQMQPQRGIQRLAGPARTKVVSTVKRRKPPAGKP